jgi:hypothetical protein
MDMYAELPWDGGSQYPLKRRGKYFHSFSTPPLHMLTEGGQGIVLSPELNMLPLLPEISQGEQVPIQAQENICKSRVAPGWSESISRVPNSARLQRRVALINE